MKRRTLLGGMSALSLAACTHTPPTATQAPAGAATRRRASALAHRLARQLDRGINFGNMLDAPTEGAWGVRVEESYLDLVGERGFTSAVRLPVRWSNHAKVDHVVDSLLSRGCTVQEIVTTIAITAVQAAALDKSGH
jgi:endoglucanase